MYRTFAPLRGLARGLRQQWPGRNVLGALRPLLSSRPPLTGDPEIDGIIRELYLPASSEVLDRLHDVRTRARRPGDQGSTWLVFNTPSLRTR